LFCHRFFIASVPNMMASEEPMQEVPMAVSESLWVADKTFVSISYLTQLPKVP
jgi:hypothetical protein